MTTNEAPMMTLADQWADWQAHGELRFQRCTACRAWIHLPRLCCPECGSEALAWEPSRGNGTLYSWTRTHRAFNPAFGAAAPYVCAVVELDEGVRMLTRIVDPPDGDLTIGATVTMTFDTTGDGPQLALFTLTNQPPEG